MSNVYRGTLQPLLQRVTDRSSPVNGFVREFEYRGMSEARARALFNTYISAGMEAELAVNHGICSLVATDTSGAITIDTWEIGANQNAPIVFENPRNIANIAKATLMLIRFAVEKGLSPDEAIKIWDADTNLTGQYGAAAWPAANTAGSRLYERAMRGKTEYRSFGYVLRHTTNVSNRYGQNIADVGVNNIYSTASLLSETQNANLWIYPLPGRLGYKISSITAPAGRADYLWGWLKSASSESTAANNRVNIVTEYTLDQWSTDEYATF